MLDDRSDAGREALLELAQVHSVTDLSDTNGFQAGEDFIRCLVLNHYPRLAAGTAYRSGLEPLIRSIAFDIWGIPIPDDIDPAYVKKVIRTYRNKNFAWNGRYHALDCKLRQQLVDMIAEEGGSMTLEDIKQRYADLAISSEQVTNYSREFKPRKDHLTWPPIVERTGNWTSRRLTSARALSLFTCPHCSTPITKVLRVPECSTGVICQNCLRTPEKRSPIYPAEYLDL